MEKITSNIKIKSSNFFHPISQSDDIAELINYKGVARVIFINNTL